MAEAAQKGLAVKYVGFRDVEGRREYELHVQRGDETRRYTLWIGLAAFSRAHVLLQDGPDICYQKLVRELAGAEEGRPGHIAVTEHDLAAYREAHAAPARRGGFSAPRPSAAAKTPADGPPGATGRVA
jgi:hypothetical protein